MQEHCLLLNIFGLYVSLTTKSNELFERVKKDFSFFQEFGKGEARPMILGAHLEKPDYSLLEGAKRWRISKNSITYDKKNLRYNDYHGKLLSAYDYAREEGNLWSEHIEKLHEVTYLLILSLTGKKLDVLGYHKIHAMGLVYRGVCLVGMMESGVGKSTLLGELLNDSAVHLLSDDTPLIDREGRVHPFPLRLGFHRLPKGLRVRDYKSNVYHIEREHHGRKVLVCLNGIANPVAKNGYRKLLVFEGRRIKGEGIIISQRGFLPFFYALLKHMVVGLGCPLILEYFWRRGPRDFFVKTSIALLRLRCALKLVWNHDFYSVCLGENPRKNAVEIKKWLDSTR